MTAQSPIEVEATCKQYTFFFFKDHAAPRVLPSSPPRPSPALPLLFPPHAEPHHRALVVEHELGERLRELRLADAGRAEEDERADRSVRVLQAGARSPQRV